MSHPAESYLRAYEKAWTESVIGTDVQKLEAVMRLLHTEGTLLSVVMFALAQHDPAFAKVLEAHTDRFCREADDWDVAMGRPLGGVR